MGKKTKKILLSSVCLAIVLMFTLVTNAQAADNKTEYVPAVYQTFCALIPPIIAIVLALITKEVYSSLFIGIIAGGILYSGGSFEKTVVHIFNDGIISVLSDSYNVGIIIFLVLLGTLVALMNKAGGSKAFGEWAGTHIKTKAGAQLATIILGALIFIDDYFNCLTVGSVMLPVTEKHKISRAKFAYLIDSTAAPVCIIAPISSCAAAASGFVEGEDGLSLFVKAIPYNYYAILTIIMMVTMVLLKVEFGPMAKHEKNAEAGDLFTSGQNSYDSIENPDDTETKGKVIDLIIPIISLVICCVIGMIYTGGFFEGADFVTAFSQSDASVGLVLGSFFGLVITIILYVLRKVLSFTKCMDCLVTGFKAMVPAILILTLAWSLKSVTDSLGAKEFVAGTMAYVPNYLMRFLPSIVFLVGCFLAFATGTSWGTFGILIPIVVNIFSGTNYELMIMSVSACMAGAVCGDHCSPISDTTIMSSAGARCNHLNHVSTQIPYAFLAAEVSFISYVVAGLILNPWISLPIAIALMILTVFAIKSLKRDNNTQM